MQKIRKILKAVSEKTTLPTNQYQSLSFWANFETFLRISPNQEFFSKIWLCHFSTFIVPKLNAKYQKNL